jgi:hypothetical protein
MVSVALYWIFSAALCGLKISKRILCRKLKFNYVLFLSRLPGEFVLNAGAAF